MTENRPSKKQRELLSFIDGFIKGNGYGPSYREIMRALDYKSVSTVAVHIDGLIKRGLLYKKDNSARTLEVVRQNVQVAETGDDDAKAHRAWLVEVVSVQLAQLNEMGGQVNHDDVAILIEALRILGYKKEHATLRAQLDEAGKSR
jgi:repressor LexA